MASATNGTTGFLLPRAYQEEIFLEARTGNVIAVLDTGSGKTFIAALLVRWLSSQPDHAGKKMFFLVPTVALVQQQRDFVANQTTGLRIGGYTGSMGVDLWDRPKWLEQLEAHDVFVMTPAILVRLLMHNYITMLQISLLIFDEVHNARGNHPYADIMRSYFGHSSISPVQRPKVFGMTASPNWSIKKPAAEIAALEKLMHASVKSVEKNRDELRTHSPHAKIAVVLYPTPSSSSKPGPLWKDICLIPAFQDLLLVNEPFDSTDPNRLVNRYQSTCTALGTYAGDYYIFSCLERTKASISQTTKLIAAISLSKLHEQMPIIQRFLDKHRPRFDPRESIAMNDVSHKVWHLVELLNLHKSDGLQAIVFVQMRNEVQTLTWLLPRLEGMEWVRPVALVGHGSADMQARGNSVVQQQQIVREFRQGKYNVLIATNVAEEGLDFQALSVVIKFDPILTVVSLQQSLGRARKANSVYYAMMPQDRPEEIAKLRLLVANSPLGGMSYRSPPLTDLDLVDFEDSEELLQQETRHRYVTEKGAILTYSTAIPLLSELCATIPVDKYTTPLQPIYTGNFEASVTLPSALPIPRDALGYEGPICKSKGGAKRAVAYKAVRALHMLGVFDDYLLPVRETASADCEDADGRKACDMKVPKMMDVTSITPFDIPWEGGRTLWVHPVFIDGAACCGLVVTRQLSIGPQLHSWEVGAIRLGNGTRLHFGNEKERLDRLNLMDAYSLQGTYWGVTTAPASSQSSSVFLVPMNVDTQLPDYPEMQSFIEKPTCIWTQDTHLQHPGPLLARNRRRHRALLFTRVRDDLTPLSQPEAVKGSFDDAVFSSYLEVWDPKNQKGPPIEVKPDDMMLEFRELRRARTAIKLISRLPTDGDEGKIELDDDGPVCILPHSVCVSLRLPLPVYRAFTILPALLRHITGHFRAAEFHRRLGLPHIDRGRLVEALTCPLVTAGFDYQRLETLGDSCLKVATSVHCFNKFPHKHEGQLTALRVNSVSNRYLRGRALEHNLSKYMDSERVIHGRTWTLPSRSTTFPSLEEGEGSLVQQRLPRKALPDGIEATLGAAWVTGGMKGVLETGTALNLCFGGATSWPERYNAVEPVAPVRDTPAPFRALYERLGYDFRNPWLLVEALTHPSFQSLHTASYQRLELLGDAIIELFIIQYLFPKYPKANPGKLSHARAAAVCNFTLAAVAVRVISLDKAVFHSSPLLGEAMEAARKQFEGMSWSDIICNTWKYDVPKALGDLTEAVVGAILVDSDWELKTVFNVLHTIMVDVLNALHPEIPFHPTTQLMVYVSRNGCRAVRFRKDIVPDIVPQQFLVAVQVHGEDIVSPVPGPTVAIAKSLTCDVVLNKFLDGELDLRSLCTCAADAANRMEQSEQESIANTSIESVEEVQTVEVANNDLVGETEEGFAAQAEVARSTTGATSTSMVECDKPEKPDDIPDLSIGVEQDAALDDKMDVD